MELKQLGNSSVRVTPIAFGAWAIGGWMWGGAEEKEAIDAIRTSLESGITTIDTAPIYGFGKSEELIGQALKGIPRDKYQILTKYGMSWLEPRGEFFFDSVDNDGKPIKIYKYAGRESVLQECEDSLKRLKVDYIDLLQIHWADGTTPISETMGAVAKLIEQGKVRAAGVCNYNAKQVEEALKTVKIVSNQVPYSMIHRDVENELVPQALSKGMSIIPYSPLQRGLLTGKIKRDHKFTSGDTREGNVYYKPENIDRTNTFLQKIKPIADGYGVTLSQLVINWTTRQPAMDCVLVGARNKEQVLENVKSLSFRLTDEEVQSISKSAEELKLVK
ncbi:MAG TPA: aldo/keto reductase [Chryseolinea sp.]|nr:aldo/keto reductase [Chryseolinea sp.]